MDPYPWEHRQYWNAALHRGFLQIVVLKQPFSCLPLLFPEVAVHMAFPSDTTDLAAMPCK